MSYNPLYRKKMRAPEFSPFLLQPLSLLGLHLLRTLPLLPLSPSPRSATRPQRQPLSQSAGDASSGPQSRPGARLPAPASSSERPPPGRGPGTYSAAQTQPANKLPSICMMGQAAGIGTTTIVEQPSPGGPPNHHTDGAHPPEPGVMKETLPAEGLALGGLGRDQGKGPGMGTTTIVQQPSPGGQPNHCNDGAHPPEPDTLTSLRSAKDI